MKINLLMNSNAVLSGFLNIDILPGENKVQGDLSNLDSLVDDASCTEIVARNVLEYVPHTKVLDVLTHWVKKLSHGGKITINTTDLRSVAKGILRDTISIDETLSVLYGPLNNPLNCKKSAMTAHTLSALLSSLGLVITNKMIDSYEISITAERQ